MPPCASCRRASGTGRHRTRAGSRLSRGTRNVSSYAIDDGKRLLLFDPLGVPGEIEELAAGRETAIVLTCPWHERDTQSLVERLGVPVFAPPPETQEDLMEKFGITAEQAAGRQPRPALAENGGHAREDTGSSPAIGCPSASRRSSERIRRTSCIGSRANVRSSPATHSSTSARAWRSTKGGYAKVQTREEVAEEMRPLLELPVELVLPTHGAPTDRAALERALA